jgi:integrase
MPIVTLTARFVDGLKPQRSRVEYSDTLVPGLAVRVTPNGAKTYAVRYRNKHNRQRRFTIGDAAVVTLAQARDRARDELYAAGKGDDPAATRAKDRNADTFGQLAELYIERWAKVRKRSWKADDAVLRNKILPKWRSRALAEITRADILDLVEGIADAGAPILANRVVALLSRMFGFALDRGLITASPAVRIPRPGKEQPRDRVLNEDELRTAWTDFGKLDSTMAAFYKLRLLTLQRGGEVASMRWQDLDLKGGWWTIPATHAKNKLAHRVPLNASALTIIEALQPPADEKQPKGARFAYVMTGARGKRQQAEAAATFTVDDFVGHDLRRTAASFMASGGVQRLTIKKLLNHVERDITAVYDRHSYDPEKRTAVNWWDTKLTAILANKSASVLAFARG